MSATTKLVARIALAALLVTLAACGGGGGDGDGGGPSVSPSTSSVTFVADDPSSSTPPAQSVTLTLSGGSAWLGTTSAYGTLIANAVTSISGPTTAQVTITPASPFNLGVGTHTGSVTVQVCADQYCNAEIAGSPFTINVTYVVGGFSGSPTSISLNAAEGETPVAVSESITNTSGSAAWTSSVVYNGATTNWLTLSAESGVTLPVTLSVGATPLPVGTYSATIQLAIPGKTLDIPVTYVVAKAMAPNPALMGFSIGTTVVPADLVQSVNIGTNYPAGSPKTINWSAVVDVPWLSITSAGNSSSQPTLTGTLVQAQLDQMLNGIHWGYITLSSPDANVSDVTIPVSLYINRAQANYVSPYVAAANTSAQVIIRGRNFSQTSVTNVKFGNFNASAFQVVSDTEIRATHPALSAGQYPVSFTTTGGGIVSSATLVVTNPATLTDLTFLDSSATKGILHDPERNAVLVFPLSGSFIERHTYNGSTWSASSVTLPYAFGPGLMTPDGKEIVLLTQDYKIVRVDAVSLTELSASGSYAGNPTVAAVMNDGEVLMRRPYSMNAVNLPWTSITASGDGSRAILRYDNSATPTSSSLYSFDAGTGIYTAITPSISGPVNSMDRTGSRFLTNNTNIYNSSMALVGNLPYFNDAANSCSTSLATLSPDGTRAYTFCDLSANGRVYTYDLMAATVGGYFPAIGGYVTTSPGINSMQISSDGKTLFLIDNATAYIVSLP